MNISFINSFRSEWLKRKRSASSWLVIIGAFFIPLILLIAQFVNHETIALQNTLPNYWEFFFRINWESMAMFLLPMGIVLSTSMTAQIEYKNNTWKQVMTTPQLYSTIFFSKFMVILAMMVQFFILFNIGIYLSAIIPALILSDVPFPQASYPFLMMLEITGKAFVACLPIMALQFLLSLHFRNFMVSVGIGLVMIIGSIMALSWTYGYLVPYTYSAYNFLMSSGEPMETAVSIYLMSVIYFVGFTAVNFLLYLNKAEKG